MLQQFGLVVFYRPFFFGEEGALKIPGSGKSTLVGALMLTAGAISERELMKRRKDLISATHLGWVEAALDSVRIPKCFVCFLL